jgi:hypothetical protein
MNKIVVQLPSNRDYAGKLEIQNAAGKRIAGPFRVCGRADDESAQQNKNPQRDPLLPFGDTPFGEYQIVKVLPSGPGTAYGAEEFGPFGIVLMKPRLGDAALADANGRFGFFIQGGARSRNGLLRPTVDGSLRLSDYDQRKFISALQKTGTDCFCLLVSTAKLGAKVAVAKIAGKSRRNTPASILLASSVIASTVTGVVRQAWMRTMAQGVGTVVASGVAFVAEHAHGQNAGDYNPTGVSGQLNDAAEHGQNAVNATSDEQAHDEAGKVFDTQGTTPPAVDLSGKQGIVEPNAAAGGMPPATDAGQAPGSPVNEETTPANPQENQNTTEPETTPAETQPPAQDNPQTTEAPALPSEPVVAPVATPTEAQPPAATAPVDNTQTTEPGTAPMSENAPVTTAPSTSSGLGSAIAAGVAGAAVGAASTAIIEHESQNLATPQSIPLQLGQKIPDAWLNDFKNTALRDWIANNVTCSNQSLPNSYGIDAGPNGNLEITPSIFNALPWATQINLLTFELGKVYWQKQADASGNTPPALLNLINNPAIGQMQDAAYGGTSLGDLTSDQYDGSSRFGILFRATLLDLPAPGPDQAKNWDSLRNGLLSTLGGNGPTPSATP